MAFTASALASFHSNGPTSCTAATAQQQRPHLLGRLGQACTAPSRLAIIGLEWGVRRTCTYGDAAVTRISTIGQAILQRWPPRRLRHHRVLREWQIAHAQTLLFFLLGPQRNVQSMARGFLKRVARLQLQSGYVYTRRVLLTFIQPCSSVTAKSVASGDGRLHEPKLSWTATACRWCSE